MQYPLAANDKDNIRTKTGKSLDDITLEAVLAGRVTAEDIRVSKDTLCKQGQVAEEAGRKQMAENFQRASELVDIPDQIILQMYNMLRPRRATKSQLLEIAHDLKYKYHAEDCAALVLEAVAVYEKRQILL